MFQKEIVIFIFLFFLILNGCSQETVTVGETIKHQKIEQSVKKSTLGHALSERGDSEAGKVIYKKYCFYCHGKEGRGDGAIGMTLTPQPADFTDDERMKKSDNELFISISEGIERGEDTPIVMPAWKAILSEKELWDVLAYVRYLSEKGKKEKANSGFKD